VQGYYSSYSSKNKKSKRGTFPWEGGVRGIFCSHAMAMTQPSAAASMREVPPSSSVACGSRPVVERVGRWRDVIIVVKKRYPVITGR
jgi:hypothetical protein